MKKISNKNQVTKFLVSLRSHFKWNMEVIKFSLMFQITLQTLGRDGIIEWTLGWDHRYLYKCRVVFKLCLLCKSFTICAPIFRIILPPSNLSGFSSSFSSLYFSYWLTFIESFQSIQFKFQKCTVLNCTYILLVYIIVKIHKYLKNTTGITEFGNKYNWPLTTNLAIQ